VAAGGRADSRAAAGPKPAQTGDLKSLAHNSAFVAMDSVSKSFGALGCVRAGRAAAHPFFRSSGARSGLALLSLDPGFVAARRAQIIDERPEGLSDGLFNAAKALGIGLVEGVGGIFAQPIAGASEAGVEGFVMGACVAAAVAGADSAAGPQAWAAGWWVWP
jgi:hypothetical protein